MKDEIAMAVVGAAIALAVAVVPAAIYIGIMVEKIEVLE